MVSSVQQAGRAAAASGVLMTVGVEGEWLFNPQRDDGTITNLPVFALLLLTATAGFALLLTAVRGLRAHATRSTRPARAGAFMSLLGAGLLVAFGVLVLVTSLLSGSPLEAAFIAFLLGMLLLSVGPVTWGLSLRKGSPAPGAWQALLVSGVAGFGALALEADPWHDVSLVVMFAAWSVLGLLLLRGAPRPAPERPSGHVADRTPHHS